jgi:hypothetical protein
MPTNRETVNAAFPPCPDCGVALTDPSVQNQPDYPKDGPLRQPTPYLRLAATAEQAGAHIFDLPTDIHPELVAAIALRFDADNQIQAIISLATDIDENLRTDVLAYALALYTADPLHIANQPDAILTISRTRLPPTTHGPGHLAWHLLHSHGRQIQSATFRLINL